MALKALRLRSGRWIGLLLLGLLLALHLLSHAIVEEKFSHWFIPALFFIVINLIGLLLIIGRNIRRLWREYRQKLPGSRLIIRTVFLFITLSLLPVGIVYYYSVQFLNQGIDNWFNVHIDSAMKDALELNRATLNLGKRWTLRYTEQMFNAIQDSSQTALALTLSELRQKAGASELTLADFEGRIIASSQNSPDHLLPSTPDPLILEQVINGQSYVGFLEQEDGMYISCLVADPTRGLILHALYPVSSHIADLSEQVQNAFITYKHNAYLRKAIKFSFVFALSLVLLFTVLAAIWMALRTARRMIAPIQAIAAGTRAIAEGELNGRIPVPSHHDELGFLVASFNTMTRRLAQARDIAEERKQALEFQRRYLETILQHLSTGVLAFDSSGQLKRINTAAEHILQVDLKPYIGHSLHSLLDIHYAELHPLIDFLNCQSEQKQDQRKTLILQRPNGKQYLLCACTHLDDGRGCVLVFDDITALIKAQKDAAWAEVARRLAHEIKNPLTPIQLSAERLRRKYLPDLGEKGKVLDRATQTIIHQVDAMKWMVNAFSDYAKPSQLNTQLDIHELISEVISLYGDQIRFEPADQTVYIQADPIRLRQVLHNLIKNALEATENCQHPDIQLCTHILHPEGQNIDLFHLVIEDNGHGFGDLPIDQLFEPYVTHKEKGTGLGLAIVKKIIEEHGGTIMAENKPKGGARFIIQLPVHRIEKDTGDSK